MYQWLCRISVGLLGVRSRQRCERYTTTHKESLLLPSHIHDSITIIPSAEAYMKKRNQINVTLEDAEAENINEYCRVNDRTPQWLLKAGAQRLLEEDHLERKADLMTIQSWLEIGEGRSEPIDDLLDAIEKNRQYAREIILPGRRDERKSA